MSSLTDFTREVFVEGPQQLNGAEATAVALVNGGIGTLLLSPNTIHDTTSQVIDILLTKPAGITCAVFGALCLKQAMSIGYNHLHDKLASTK